MTVRAAQSGRALLSDNSGVSFAEYAIVLSIIAAVIALAALTLSESLGRKMAQVEAEIRKGQAAFIKPRDMNVGGWYPIEFIAGPTIETLTAESEELPLTTPRPIYVSESMRVQLLKDPNFEIRAKIESAPANRGRYCGHVAVGREAGRLGHSHINRPG